MLQRYLQPRFLIASIALLLVFAMVAVACGSDPTATAVTSATAVPAAKATTAPAPKATTAPAPKATTAPSASQPTPTTATGAFRPKPTTDAATPKPEPTKAALVESRGEPKVETLVIAVDPSAGETNLPWNGTVDHHQQMDLVMEVLVDIEPTTNNWVPELAKSWELSSDGTEWTFILEEGIQFHDNWGEFTSADVMHSIAMNQAEDVLLAYATDWREIDLDASTTNGDYEVMIKLKNPNPDYLFYIAPSGGGLMMSKAQWDAGGVEAYEEDMIGTGPYRYTGREFGVNVTFELLPDHWRRNNPAPDFEKVDLRWIKEVATRNAGLLSEEIHLTDLTRDLADSAVAGQGYKIISSIFPGNQINGIFQGLFPEFAENFDPPYMYPDLPYTDIRVREAINRAIDKQLIMDTLFAGRVTLSPQIGFYSNLPGWNQDWIDNMEENYGYDPDKARALLLEAGYGPDNPAKFSGKLMNFPGFPEAQDLMQSIDSMLREVGIEMELQELEFANFFTALRAKEPLANGLWMSPPSFKTVFAQMSLFNRSSGAIHFFEAPELDRLFALLSASADPVERDGLQRDMGNYLYDNYAYVPLVYIFIEFVANPNIIDQWPFPGSDGANYGHFDLITACRTQEPCLN